MSVIKSTGIFKTSDTGGGGGGDTYTNLTPTSTTIGGIESGSIFNAKTMQEMWDLLLYPYIDPTFASFSISGQTTPLEVGDSIAANRTFLWSTTTPTNIQTNSISILDVTNATTITSSLGNTGSYVSTIAAITKTTATSHQFRIEALDTQSSTLSRNYSVSWQWRRYYGEDINVGPLLEADIESLRVSSLASGFVGTYSFAAGGYKYLVYPAVFGTATTFKDTSTNLNVPFEAPYTVDVTNSFGVTTSYRVHRTTNVLGGAINIQVS